MRWPTTVFPQWPVRARDIARRLAPLVVALIALASGLGRCAGEIPERLEVPVDRDLYWTCVELSAPEDVWPRSSQHEVRAFAADVRVPGVGATWSESEPALTAYRDVVPHDDGTFVARAARRDIATGHVIEEITRGPGMRPQGSALSPDGRHRIDAGHEYVRIDETAHERVLFRRHLAVCGREFEGEYREASWLDASTPQLWWHSGGCYRQPGYRVTVWDLPTRTTVFSRSVRASFGWWVHVDGYKYDDRRGEEAWQHSTVMHVRTGATIVTPGQIVGISEDGRWVASYDAADDTLTFAAESRAWRVRAVRLPRAVFSRLGRFVAWNVDGDVLLLDLERGLLYGGPDALASLVPRPRADPMKPARR